MIELSKILGNISQIICLLPLSVAVINFRYLKGYLKPLFFLSIAGAFAELLSYVLFTTHHRMLIVSYTYTLTEFTFISLFYNVFFRQYMKTFIFILVIPLFFAFCILVSYLYGVQRADHYNLAMECFVFTCYCLFLFYFLLKNLLFDNLLKAPVFWINTGILFYFTGNLTIFIFSSYLAEHPSERNCLLWDVTHTFFNVAMSVLFSIGLWKARVK